MIPAYNESESIAATLEKIYKFLEPDHVFEIIVVDDGSADDTAGAVARFAEGRDNMRLIRNPVNRGKGFSVRTGVSSARGGLILITDADLSVPIDWSLPFVKRINEGCDVVIASRYMKDSVFLRAKPVRQAMGRIFNFITKCLLGFRYRDTQCGFKLLRAETAKEIFPRCRVNRFAYDVELLLLARKSGARVIEEPVFCINSPRSRVRIFNDSVIMLRDIIALRFRKL
ncbi:MAG: dolichyl-phosphate beta-glucosyltransferase [bacterium]